MNASDSMKIYNSKIEIGSEFDISLNELTEKNNNILNYLDGHDIKLYNYGRTAIRQIPVPDNKKVLLPEFICDSVIECFEEKQILFYQIDINLDIVLDDLLNKINDTVGCIYIAHYFGYLQSKNITDKLKRIALKKNIIIIEDITQSLFSKHDFFGDYVIASLRKWMPVHQGGMLIINSEKKILRREKKKLPVSSDNYRVYPMILKNMFLNQQYDTNAKYREMFVESENDIDAEFKEEKISELAVFLLKCVDIKELISKRKDNLFFLRERLTKLGLMSIKKFKENECPMVYPVRVKNRDDFRKYLIENRIYCAVHWPYNEWCGIERHNAMNNARTLLSLPLDQRYEKRELDYMVDIIKKYGGELLF